MPFTLVCNVSCEYTTHIFLESHIMQAISEKHAHEISYHGRTLYFNVNTFAITQHAPQEIITPQFKIPTTFPIPSKMKKLVLLLEKGCNLKCKYCFVSEASSYACVQQTRMDSNTAIKAIQHIMNLYPEGIDSILCFGGEPMLNQQVIFDVQDYLEKNFSIGHRPHLNIITNGTCFDENMISFLKKYQIPTTISLDGTKEINDRCRVSSYFPSVFEQIQRNLRKIVAGGKSQFPLFLDMTITHYHIEMLKPGETQQILHELQQMGFRGMSLGFIEYSPPHLCISLSDIEKAKTIFHEVIDYCNQSLLTTNPFILSSTVELLKVLISKQAVQIPCGLGTNTLTITPDGDIYPCYLFCHDTTYSMGNVHQPCNHARMQQVVHTMYNNITHTHQKNCASCWQRYMCKAQCPGIALLHQGDYALSNPIECAYATVLYENLIGFLGTNADKLKMIRKNLESYHSNTI